MADELIVDNDAALAASVWDEKPAAAQQAAATTVVEEKKSEEKPIVEEKKSETETADEVLDTNVYIKQRFGWESEEQGLEELKDLREKAKTPAQIKFANEQSEKFFTAISEGKEDDIYKYLYDKKQLERAEKLDLTKPTEAAEIIRLNLQYKYPDLSAEEIQDYFQETYIKPTKPEKAFDQDDAEYQTAVAQWQQQCDAVDKRIIREAKMVRPDLAKFKTELILPKIEKAPTVPAQRSQEDLAKEEQDKKAFSQDVDKGLSQLKGFGATYKDKDVEIPVSYDITPEDKAKIKPIIESLYTDWSYFVKRWEIKEGSCNTEKMAKDLYLLENGGNVHQKFVNDSAAKMLEHIVKTKKNLNVSGPSNPTKVEVKDAEKQFEEAVWSNS